ncbi:MAG: DUF4328 domain-containing protein [Candidatus Xenobiia bacterium LiM19]
MVCFPAIDYNSDSLTDPESLYLISAGCFSILNGLIFFTSFVLFLIWLYRMSKNARALGAMGMQFSPGWTVGWFFIPICCLFQPYYAVKELWSASDPDCTDGYSWQKSAVPSMVICWWIITLVSSILSKAVIKLSFKSEELGVASILPPLTIFSYIIDFVSAVLVIQLIQQLHERLQEKASIQSQRRQAFSQDRGASDKPVEMNVVLSQPENVSSEGAEETAYPCMIDYEASGGKERFEKTVTRGSDIASQEVAEADLQTGDVSYKSE